MIEERKTFVEWVKAVEVKPKLHQQVVKISFRCMSCGEINPRKQSSVDSIVCIFCENALLASIL